MRGSTKSACFFKQSKINASISFDSIPEWKFFAIHAIDIRARELKKEINALVINENYNRDIFAIKHHKIQGLNFIANSLNNFPKNKFLQENTFDLIVDEAKKHCPDLLKGFFSETKELLFYLSKIYINAYFGARRDLYYTQVREMRRGCQMH